MPETRTYLELSEEGDGAHKYYEVVVDGVDVTVTYGRIGAKGQTGTVTHATPEKAAADAKKKVAVKLRKGYEPAVQGVRQPRAITRREIVSRPTTARNSAPVLWRYRTGSSAFGIFVDSERVLVGNQRGDVWFLDHTGVVTGRYQLPNGVKCIVADDSWIYAGCDNGNVYDVGGKAPRVAYEITDNIDIYWLDIHDGVLGVSDSNGGCTTIDHEDESLWAAATNGTGAWMVRCDENAIFHGHSAGVQAFAAGDGKELWRTKTRGGVLFGWQEKDDVYAGTSGNKVHRIAKSDGTIRTTYDCDASVFSCATAENGKYVFAGDSSSTVYCFAEDGKRLWKLGTTCGSAYSMQYHDERLYIVTTDGSLACIDVSEAAIEAAQVGTVPQVRDVKAATIEAVVPTTEVATTTDAGTGVVVECVDQGGGRLRVHVVTAGYESGWNVQFPKNVRVAGARYVVDSVHPADRGGFYRVRGEIRRLV